MSLCEGGRKNKTVTVLQKHPVQVQKRNARERNRVRQVNMGFVTLRNHVPVGVKSKKLSKVETLREASRYISYLQEIISSADIVEKQQSGPTVVRNGHFATSAYADVPISNSYSNFLPSLPVYQSEENLNPQCFYPNSAQFMNSYECQSGPPSVPPNALKIESDPSSGSSGFLSDNSFDELKFATFHSVGIKRDF